MTDFRIIEKPNKEEYPEYSEMYMELINDSGNILQCISKPYWRARIETY